MGNILDCVLRMEIKCLMYSFLFILIQVRTNFKLMKKLATVSHYYPAVPVHVGRGVP